MESDNFAFDGYILHYVLGHFCILMLLVFISEVAAKDKLENRASAGTSLFYAVTSLVLIGFGLIIFLDEVWPLL